MKSVAWSLVATEQDAPDHAPSESVKTADAIAAPVLVHA